MAKRGEKENKRSGVLICGAYGMSNAGDEAILEAVVGQLRSIDRDMPITVLSRTPDVTGTKHGVNSLHMFDLFGFLRVMRSCRLYINGGGSLIQDVTSSRSLWYYLYTIAAAKRRGCRVLMYGCGIGPVHRGFNRALAGWVINRYVDAITLREENSLAELAEFKVTKPETVVASDPALTLTGAPDEVVDGKMRSLGLDPEGKYICFCLREWQGFAERAGCFAGAADYAYEKYGLTPLFLSVNLRSDGTASMAAAKLMSAPHFVLEELMPTALTVGIIARMQAVVSIRLHGLIFAASQAVPTAGVSYDPKVSSFLDYIGRKNYVPLEELTEERLRQLSDKALREDRDALRAAAEQLKRVESLNTEAARRLLERK